MGIFLVFDWKWIVELHCRIRTKRYEAVLAIEIKKVESLSKDCSVYSRHGSIIQKCSYPKFLVAKNCIKNGLWNLYIFFYWRKLSQFWGQFSNTALVQSNIWHKSVLLQTLSINIDHVYFSVKDLNDRKSIQQMILPFNNESYTKKNSLKYILYYLLPNITSRAEVSPASTLIN